MGGGLCGGELSFVCSFRLCVRYSKTGFFVSRKGAQARRFIPRLLRQTRFGMHMVRSHHSPQSPSSNRKSARISPVRVRRQHLLALRGQGPFGILLRDETQYDEFVADGIGRQVGAAVGQTFVSAEELRAGKEGGWT